MQFNNNKKKTKQTKKTDMKKQLKLVALALILSLTTFTMVNAQSFKKSDKILEGTVGYSKTTDVKASWSLNPTVGYFVTNRLAIGVSGEFGETEMGKTTNVGVFGRCYILNLGQKGKIYSQLSVASNSMKMGSSKTSSSNVDLGLGANYFVTSKLALTMHIADLVSYENQSSQSTLSVGFDGVDNPFAVAKFGVLYKF